MLHCQLGRKRFTVPGGAHVRHLMLFVLGTILSHAISQACRVAQSISLGRCFLIPTVLHLTTARGTVQFISIHHPQLSTRARETDSETSCYDVRRMTSGFARTRHASYLVLINPSGQPASETEAASSPQLCTKYCGMCISKPLMCIPV